MALAHIGGNRMAWPELLSSTFIPWCISFRTAEGALDFFYLCLENNPGTEFKSSSHLAEMKMPVILAAHCAHLCASLQRDPGVSGSAAPFPLLYAGLARYVRRSWWKKERSGTMS